MVSKSLPDLNRAVTRFLNGFSQLQHLPFLTGDEANGLFGPEVESALAELDLYNQQNRICGSCQYRCCLRVKCEFYDAHFSRCMVENDRPALCRLHFCNKYSAERGPLIRILGDIYLESLLAAAPIDRARAAMFDCPAFYPLEPQLTAQISLVLEKIRTGKISEAQASREIQDLIEQPPAAGGQPGANQALKAEN